METSELMPKEKQQLEQASEQTRPGRYYVPQVDIHESDHEIRIFADMPGVSEKNVTVELQDDVLAISGQVSTEEYEGLRPMYTEYNVGNFVRRFTLSNASRLDRERISARIVDGVLELRIPKAERAKPRRIEVRSGGA